LWFFGLAIKASPGCSVTLYDQHSPLFDVKVMTPQRQSHPDAQATATRAAARARPATPAAPFTDIQITLAVAEVRRLLKALVTVATRALRCALCHRRAQAAARRSRYQKRLVST
jgi:hypothetical protein